ncbi:MAG: S24/S26 family peptidase [Lachnospiraceae bacterium]|nr:S24/S26 family peptidase [Lachnospiraceae bacterium]
MPTTQITTLEMPQLIEKIRTVTDAGETFPLQVMGYSMNPTLGHARDTVYLVSEVQRSPKKGEIVFFVRPDGRGVLHRLIRILPDGSFLINGDGQCWTETICPEQIIAVVSHFRRKNQLISCDGHLYQMYVRFWNMLRPVRPVICKVMRSFGRKQKHQPQ